MGGGSSYNNDAVMSIPSMPVRLVIECVTGLRNVMPISTRLGSDQVRFVCLTRIVFFTAGVGGTVLARGTISSAKRLGYSDSIRCPYWRSEGR